MTDFDVISIQLKSPLQFVEFDVAEDGSGFLALETHDPADAFMLLFSLEGATTA